MDYLILSNYDGGAIWSVMSSVGDINDATTREGYEMAHPILQQIFDFMEDRKYSAFQDEIVDFLYFIGGDFNLLMICEDGGIYILQDTKEIL